MTNSHRRYILCAVAGAACVLSGCVPSRTKYSTFANAFLPATPQNAQAQQPLPKVASAEPANLYSQEKVVLPKLSTPAAPDPLDAYAAKADEHVAAGRRLYEAGDSAGARREFDLAIDVLLTVPANLPDRTRLERKLERVADMIFRYDVEGLGAGKSGDEIVYDKPPLDDILEMTFPVDPNLKPKVSEELSATVSQLPLELSDPVLSFVHYFSSDRGHRILAGGLRRAGRYRAMVERILAEEGVPKELIFLAQEESGFLPRARSNKACVGMWQFSQFTGKEYGLTQTAHVDDRMDPEKATRAAAKHLRDLYQHFGDWYLAMAAYDCGPYCVDRAIERTGYADFWDLHRLNALPQETKNYVPLIVAMTIMAKNPKDYGLDGLDMDAPMESDKVTLAASTSLALVADAVGSTVAELEDLNPSLLHGIAPEALELRIPKGTAGQLDTALAQVPLERRSTWRIHRAESGDTLALVAKRFGSTPSLLASANSGVGAELSPGELLVVPIARTQPPASSTRRRATTASASRTYGKKNIAGHSKAVRSAAVHKPSKGVYTAASLRPPAKRRAVNR